MSVYSNSSSNSLNRISIDNLINAPINNSVEEPINDPLNKMTSESLQPFLIHLNSLTNCDLFFATINGIAELALRSSAVFDKLFSLIETSLLISENEERFTSLKEQLKVNLKNDHFSSEKIERMIKKLNFLGESAIENPIEQGVTPLHLEMLILPFLNAFSKAQGDTWKGFIQSAGKISLKYPHYQEVLFSAIRSYLPLLKEGKILLMQCTTDTSQPRTFAIDTRLKVFEEMKRNTQSQESSSLDSLLSFVNEINKIDGSQESGLKRSRSDFEEK